jgi:hypothetical protein
MASTGATLVTSGVNAGTGVAWSNPGNITADDSTNASVSTSTGQASQFLVGKSLGFSIPSVATITGIEVLIDASVSTGQQQFVYITKDGSTNGGTSKTGTQTTSVTTRTYGSSSDLWGTTWTPAEINTSTFGAMFLTQRIVSSSGGSNVDFIKINVHYTTPTGKYWVGGTATWDTTAGSKWASTPGGAGGQPIPTSSDDVFFGENSGAVTVTLGAAAFMNKLNTNGFTGTLSSGAYTFYMYGDILIESNTTLTSGSSSIFFLSQGSATRSIIIKPSYPTKRLVIQNGGTATLNYALTGGAQIEIDTGTTLDTNNYNITCNSFNANTGGVATLGSSVIDATGTGTVITLTGTVNVNTSTFKCSNNSSSSKTLSLGSKTLNNLWVNTSGTGVTTISGSNTFNDLKISGGSIAAFTAGTTQTVTTFTSLGSLGSLSTIRSSSAGSAFTLSKSSGTVNVGYMSIKDSTATGGATWNADSTCINVSNNTGWVFSSINNTNFIPFL